MSCVEQSTTEYRVLKEYPGYRVGSDGSIWSCRKPSGPKALIGTEWKRLAQIINSSGRPVITLMLPKGKKKIRPIHQLVLEAFVGPRPDGMVARHFPDRNMLNNNLSNLMWGTHKENADDRRMHGTTCQGEKHHSASLTEEIVLEIRKSRTGKLGEVLALAKKYGVGRHSITNVVKGRTWKHLLPSSPNGPLSIDHHTAVLESPRV